jgi:hypothetical protein
MDLDEEINQLAEEIKDFQTVLQVMLEKEVV